MIAYMYGGISKAALAFYLCVLIFQSGIELLQDLKSLQLSNIISKGCAILFIFNLPTPR